MKNLEFQDYTTTFEDADGDEHETTVSACVITDDLVYITDAQGNKVRRELQTIGGPRQVSSGDVYVTTERADVFDYLSAAAWASTGYGGDAEGDAEADADDAPAPVKKAAAKRSLPSGNGS